MLSVLVALALAADPTPADAVAVELGVGPVALKAAVGRDYLPDAVTPDAAARMPVRAAVKLAADAMAQSRLMLEKNRELHQSGAAAKGKDEVLNLQAKLAGVILGLVEASQELDDAADERAKEPSKRWQAHLDYLTGAVTLRYARLEEVNLLYGDVRTDKLPVLDAAAGHTGWRLVPAERMHSKKDVRAAMEQARERLAKVAKDHPNTPWAELAERDLAEKPGLMWEPAAVKPPAAPVRKKK